jgi:hypothetical protein
MEAAVDSFIVSNLSVDVSRTEQRQVQRKDGVRPAYGS